MRSVFALVLLGAFGVGCGAPAADVPLKPPPPPPAVPAPIELTLSGFMQFYGFSPDGRWAAFLNARGADHELHALNVMTGEHRVLDHSVRNDIGRSGIVFVSPRGTGVVYRRFEEPRTEGSLASDLYFVTWAGERTRIGERTRTNLFRFALDGRVLIHVDDAATGPALRAYDFDTGEDRLITAAFDTRTSSELVNASLPLTDGGRAVVYVADGMTYVEPLLGPGPVASIAHARREDVTLIDGRLIAQVVDPSSAEQVVVSRDLSTHAEIRSPPVFYAIPRADGDRAVVATAIAADGGHTISILDLRTGALTDAGVVRGQPRFGPTGDLVAIDGEGRLVVVDAATGTHRVVGDPTLATWYLDGIAFAGTRVFFKEARAGDELRHRLVTAELGGGPATVLDDDVLAGPNLVDGGRAVFWQRRSGPDATRSLGLQDGVITRGRGGPHTQPSTFDTLPVLLLDTGASVVAYRWRDGAEAVVHEGPGVVVDASAHAVIIDTDAEGADGRQYRIVPLPL